MMLLRFASGILSLFAVAGYVEVVVAHFRPDVSVTPLEILAAVALAVVAWLSLHSSILETIEVGRAIGRIAERRRTSSKNVRRDECARTGQRPGEDP